MIKITLVFTALIQLQAFGMYVVIKNDKSPFVGLKKTMPENLTLKNKSGIYYLPVCINGIFHQLPHDKFGQPLYQLSANTYGQLDLFYKKPTPKKKCFSPPADPSAIDSELEKALDSLNKKSRQKCLAAQYRIAAAEKELQDYKKKVRKLKGRSEDELYISDSDSESEFQELGRRSSQDVLREKEDAFNKAKKVFQEMILHIRLGKEWAAKQKSQSYPLLPGSLKLSEYARRNNGRWDNLQDTTEKDKK